jgi:hypothetical protein
VTRTGTITATPTRTGTGTATPSGTATAIGTRTATATQTRTPKEGAFTLSDNGCGITQTDASDHVGFALLWVVVVLLGLRRDLVARTRRARS